ncbi:MAG: hypothetical protein WBL19_02745 [Minisyncoccia bacterium]
MDDYENKGPVRKNAVWLVVLFALLVLGAILFKGWDKVVNDEIDDMVTITGSFSCLPLKEPNEDAACTLGVKSRDGLFYALDISRIQDANTDLKVEDTIAVTGRMRLVSEKPAPEWEDFNVAGVIMVNTLLRTR